MVVCEQILYSPVHLYQPKLSLQFPTLQRNNRTISKE